MDPAAPNGAPHDQARRGGGCRCRPPPLPLPAPRKRKACNFCFNRKIGCDSNPEGCSECRSRGLTCTYSWAKPQPKRGSRRNAQNQHAPPPNAFPGPNDALAFGSPLVPAPMSNQQWDPTFAAFQPDEGFFSAATTVPSFDTPPAAKLLPMEWLTIQDDVPENAFTDPAAWYGQVNSPGAAPPSPCGCLDACLSAGHALNMNLAVPGPSGPSLPPALRVIMATAVDKLLDCIECTTKAFLQQPPVAAMLVSTLAKIRFLYRYVASTPPTPPVDGPLPSGWELPSTDLDFVAAVYRLESICQKCDFIFKGHVQAGSEADFLVLDFSDKLLDLWLSLSVGGRHGHYEAVIGTSGQRIHGGGAQRLVY
ncbi:hypothetical protein C8A01DRAFT_37631 [Parachaetomium inaequale]|uniref:Zn(2)-C6 fungal-type domain-containing protein n=1 Tax=Parachaetomium inaequale TaxID=2588326 RepID=A0AAN6SQE7_9PEZI|nr:hypothetical protein C8A01DRAFT_37631 [Parachaetomium inaequale]